MKKYGACLLSGILIAFSFPTILFGWHFPDSGYLAWFGLVPLFLMVFETTPRKAFILGFLTASVYYLISIYWIYLALHDFGHLSPITSSLTLLAMSMIMALYIGFACFLARVFAQKTKGELLIWLPIFFTLIEWGRNYTPFGGLPASNLGMSQHNYSYLIQIADVTGIYGVIFLLIWFNVWFTELILKFQGKRVTLFRQKTYVTFLLLILVLGYGYYRIEEQKNLSANAPKLKVGLIQPNIPQDEKWDDSFLPKQKALFKEAVQSLQNHVDLIVWPETAWFETLWLNTSKIAPEKFFVTPGEENQPYSLLGLSFLTLKDKEERYFNSAALLDSNGLIIDKYHKVHLVPFGEYIPLKKLFSFLKPVATIGDFEAGKTANPLTMGSWKMAPLICFEDIFPEPSRTMVRQGAHFLINITNDAWYGHTSAAYQHLALAQFRSVETRRAMVRATNTGVTAVIDPTGKVVNISPIFEQSVVVHQVPMLVKQTVYTKLGDWFIVACFLLVFWQGINICRKK